MYTTVKDDTSTLKGSNTNEQLRDNLSHAATKASRKVRDFVHHASENITDATDTVTTQIRTNPVQSSLIALGVGFVLGALFRR